MSENQIPEPDRIAGAPHPRETLDLLGQLDAEKDFLTSFNAKKLHHAWLITGPRGVGKATLAWRIARFLLAQPRNYKGMFDTAKDNTETLELALENPVIARVAALGEPRLVLARRGWDEKSKRLKSALTVDEIRKLKGFFNLSAADGGWRVAIIDSADEMNVQAANALLKILEEPPERTILLLVSHQPARLLPTIRSRCRELRCKQLSAQDLKTVLAKTDLPLPADMTQLAELSGGSVGEAMRLISGEGVQFYANLINLFEQNGGADRGAITSLADKVGGRGKEAEFETALRCIELVLSRLAKFGAIQPASYTEAAAHEARLFSNLAPNAAAGRTWAELSQKIQSRVSHARAVNLDPSNIILDTVLKIDQTARKLRQ